MYFMIKFDPLKNVALLYLLALFPSFSWHFFRSPGFDKIGQECHHHTAQLFVLGRELGAVVLTISIILCPRGERMAKEVGQMISSEGASEAAVRLLPHPSACLVGEHKTAQGGKWKNYVNTVFNIK
jgi:hypothetical protein